jgi:hypothetical protein
MVIFNHNNISFPNDTEMVIWLLILSLKIAIGVQLHLYHCCSNLFLIGDTCSPWLLYHFDHRFSHMSWPEKWTTFIITRTQRKFIRHQNFRICQPVVKMVQYFEDTSKWDLLNHSNIYVVFVGWIVPQQIWLLWRQYQQQHVYFWMPSEISCHLNQGCHNGT